MTSMDWTLLLIAFAALTVVSFISGFIRGLRPFWPLLRRIYRDVRTARRIHRTEDHDA
jgi:hypothetical protein